MGREDAFGTNIDCASRSTTMVPKSGFLLLVNDFWTKASVSKSSKSSFLSLSCRKFTLSKIISSAAGSSAFTTALVFSGLADFREYEDSDEDEEEDEEERCRLRLLLLDWYFELPLLEPCLAGDLLREE